MVDEQALRDQLALLQGQLDDIALTKRLAEATIRLGKAFRYRNCYSCPQEESDYWWTYRKVLSVDDDGHSRCLEFHVDKDGRATILEETTWSWSPGWQEIPANVYERALLLFRRRVADLLERA